MVQENNVSNSEKPKLSLKSLDLEIDSLKGEISELKNVIKGFVDQPVSIGSIGSPDVISGDIMTTEQFSAPLPPPPAILGKVPVDGFGNIPKNWEKVGKVYKKFVFQLIDGEKQKLYLDKKPGCVEHAYIVDGSIKRIIDYNKSINKN